MIESYLRRHHARFVRELQQLVRFPSVSAQPERAGDLRACADWLARHFRQLGLTVRVHRGAGAPILEATAPAARADAPVVVIYGHYDVQPPEPLELWRTPPFGAVVRGGKIFGRGASDNKGQFFAHVKALETLRATQRELPVHVRLLVEGEEEIGSVALQRFCRQHARRLRADYCIVSDSGMFAKDLPTLTYATRGIAAFEVRVDGPARDLHSGVFGGSVANPAQVLARMLAQCVDARGHVTIPGFYDAVRPLAAWERRAWRRLPFDERAYVRSLGAPAPAGEAGYTTLERRWARPTFEINGLTSGYQGAGAKTIVPAWASAKITVRLVPDQDPADIDRRVVRHLRWLCPPTVRLRIEAGHHAPPFLTDPNGPGARAARAALREAFGREAVCVREGGTIPVLHLFGRQLGAEVLLIGLGLAEDNWHAPNEKMDLENFRRGIVMSIGLLRRLGALRGRAGHRRGVC